MTCDMWHVTYGGGWTFSQNVSSLALAVWDRQYLEDTEQKGDRMNQLVNKWQICLWNSPSLYYQLAEAEQVSPLSHKRCVSAWSNVTCHMLHVIYHMSCVTYHMSCVTGHMSQIVFSFLFSFFFLDKIE